MEVESEDEEGNVTMRRVPTGAAAAAAAAAPAAAGARMGPPAPVSGGAAAKSSSSSVLVCAGPGPMGRAWLSDVVWDERQRARRPQLIMSQRDMELFVTKEATPRPVLRARVVTEAGREDSAVLTDRENKLRMAEDKAQRLASAARATGFNYSADTTVKGISTDRTMRPVEVAPPVHAPPAAEKMLLRVPRPEEVRAFRRPRVARLLSSGQRLLLKSLGAKAAGGQMEMVTLRGGRTMSTMRRERDLIPFEPSARFILVEYVEERPPLLCATGMASRVINWWRSTGGGGGAGGGAAGAGGGGRIARQASFGAEGDEKPPERPDGQPQRLEPQEESPFMGEIRAGVVQPSICNELYRAPLFEHSARDTDFLLIREPPKSSAVAAAKAAAAEGKPEKLKLPYVNIVKEIPRVYVAGQTEPQREVFAPDADNVRAFQVTYLKYHIARMFSSQEKKGMSAMELRAMFKATGIDWDNLKAMAEEFAGSRNIQGVEMYYGRSFELELTNIRDQV
ncbi:hypothetical protein JKP88DRAFT_151889, partial [Tribonema minus]